jgi:hypothetical protein
MTHFESRIAALLAVAAFGVLMLSVFSSQLAERMQALPLSPEIRAQVIRQSNALLNVRLPAGDEQCNAVTGATRDSGIIHRRIPAGRLSRRRTRSSKRTRGVAHDCRQDRRSKIDQPTTGRVRDAVAIVAITVDMRRRIAAGYSIKKAATLDQRCEARVAPKRIRVIGAELASDR